MKVYVQWTKSDVEDWEPLEAAQWRNQPKRGVPAPGEFGGLDNNPGHVYALNVQGVTFEAFDHYAVEPLPGNGCRVTVWQDDPDDFAPEEMFAQVWEFLPPAPDGRIGGRMNTRQSLTVYAGDPSRYPQSDIMAEPPKPWSEFLPPPGVVVRHGISVTDDKARAHRRSRSPRGWREWV